MTLLTRHAAFRKIFVAFVAAEFVEWLATVTLAVLVYDQTGDALATTALFVSTKLVPSLLVPVLAARSERWASGPGIGRLFVLEALVFFLLAVSTTRFSLVLICGLALLDGAIAALIRALTRAASVATLEPTGELREGNALLNVGFAVMNITGPSVAALLVLAGSPAAVLGGGGVVLAAVGAYLMVRSQAVNSTSVETASWGRRVREAGRYVLEHRTTLVLIAGEGVVLLMGTLVAPIEVIYAQTTLGAGPEGYGLLATCWGAGMTAGSVWFTRARQRRLLWLLIGSTTALGTSLLLMAVAPTLLAACAAAALGGAGNGVQWVTAITAIQESVVAEMQVRVAGLFEAVATLVPGLGFLLGGALTSTFSPRIAFAVAGISILVAAGLAYPMYRLTRRYAPRTTPAPI